MLNISQNTLSNADGGDEGGRAPQISMENVANRRRFEVPGELIDRGIARASYVASRVCDFFLFLLSYLFFL